MDCWTPGDDYDWRLNGKIGTIRHTCIRTFPCSVDLTIVALCYDWILRLDLGVGYIIHQIHYVLVMPAKVAISCSRDISATFKEFCALPNGQTISSVLSRPGKGVVFIGDRLPWLNHSSSLPLGIACPTQHSYRLSLLRPPILFVSWRVAKLKGCHPEVPQVVPDPPTDLLPRLKERSIISNNRIKR